jgi:hypothetical protein
MDFQILRLASSISFSRLSLPKIRQCIFYLARSEPSLRMVSISSRSCNRIKTNETVSTGDAGEYVEATEQKSLRKE